MSDMAIYYQSETVADQLALRITSGWPTKHPRIRTVILCTGALHRIFASRPHERRAQFINGSLCSRDC